MPDDPPSKPPGMRNRIENWKDPAAPVPTRSRGSKSAFRGRSAFGWSRKSEERKMGDPVEVTKPDEKWAREAKEREVTLGGGWITLAVVGGLLAIAAAGIAFIANQSGDGDPSVSEGADGPGSVPGVLAELNYDRSDETIEAFARAFGEETDSAKRLAMARHPAEVEARLARYPEEVKTVKVKELYVFGRGNNSPPRTAFTAQLENGSLRLLVVVETKEGLKVDWDAFARYGTAPWDDLLAGRSERADMRVFLKGEDFHGDPFDDKTTWRSYKLYSPDAGARMYGYVKAGSIREQNLSLIGDFSPAGGTRMFLRLAHRGSHQGRKLFEIERVLSQGWVTDDVDLERQWEVEQSMRRNSGGRQSALGRD